MTKSSACGRLWQFAHLRPLSLLQRGLAPRSMKFPKLNDQYLVSACVLSHFSRVELFATPWTIAGQPPLSMGFSKQEYWSELPCTLPGDLPDPGIEPASLMSPALADKFFTTAAAAKSLSRVRLLATPWSRLCLGLWLLMIPTSLLSSPSAFCICMHVKNSKVASVLDLVCGQQCLGRGAGSVSVLNFVVKCIVWTKTEMRSKIRLLSHSKELEGIILLDRKSVV